MDRTAYCNLCERRVPKKRKIGIGTLLLVFFTWGLWILVIPFYSKRCGVCGGDRLSKFNPIDPELDEVDLDDADCPLCKEPVKPGAIRCKHCQGDISERAKAQT